MQETFFTYDIESVIRAEWNGICYFNNGTNHSKGVVILIRNNLSLNSIKCFSREDGRVIALQFCILDKTYFCVNVYAPANSSQKDRFYKVLNVWVSRHKCHTDTLIVGGDFNCVQNRKLDTYGVSCIYLPKVHFKKFITNNNLVDIWRKHNPEKRQFTWRQVSLGIYSRLDYWLVVANFTQGVLSTDIRPALKCDHNAISLKIKVYEEKRGRGLWKFNSSLLSDTRYKECIKDIIPKVRLESANFDIQMQWELCKIKIREYSVKYATEMNRNNRLQIINLEKEYKSLSENESSASEEGIQRIKAIKDKIDKWYTQRCKGAKVLLYDLKRSGWKRVNVQIGIFCRWRKEGGRKKSLIVLK